MKPVHYRPASTDAFAPCGVQLVRLPGSGAPFGAGISATSKVTCRRCRRAIDADGFEEAKRLYAASLLAVAK